MIGYFINNFSCAATVLEKIMATYDKGTAPASGSLPVQVAHEISITSFSKLDEILMSFELIFIEKCTWVANELAFQSNSNIEDQYKRTFISLNPVMSDVWIPKTQITNIAKNDYRDESLVLYPNGTVSYTAIRHSVIL